MARGRGCPQSCSLLACRTHNELAREKSLRQHEPNRLRSMTGRRRRRHQSTWLQACPAHGLNAMAQLCAQPAGMQRGLSRHEHGTTLDTLQQLSLLVPSGRGSCCPSSRCSAWSHRPCMSSCLLLRCCAASAMLRSSFSACCPALLHVCQSSFSCLTEPVHTTVRPGMAGRLRRCLLPAVLHIECQTGGLPIDSW